MATCVARRLHQPKPRTGITATAVSVQPCIRLNERTSHDLQAPYHRRPSVVRSVPAPGGGHIGARKNKEKKRKKTSAIAITKITCGHVLQRRTQVPALFHQPGETHEGDDVTTGQAAVDIIFQHFASRDTKHTQAF